MYENHWVYEVKDVVLAVSKVLMAGAVGAGRYGVG
jgi:hypothetical protein